MKLYAMGGTSYDIRAVIGTWGLPSGPLKALPDVQAGPVYGAGLFGNGLPHLIHRRAMSVLDRTYAYTLLLEPSESAWMACGWNAAALWRALLDLPQSIRLLNPDGITPAEADAIEASAIEALRSRAARAPHPSSWNFACLGAIWSQSALTASRAEMRDMGWSARPSLEALEEVLDRVPPCFRIGGGWLIGGVPHILSSLGVRFCMEEPATAATSDITLFAEAVEHGQRCWDLFLELPVALRSQLQPHPLHQWEMLEPFADTLAVLAALREGQDRAPAAADTITSSLADILRRHFVEHLEAGGKLGPLQSAQLLDQLWTDDAAAPLASACIEGLDKAALDSFIARIGLLTPEGTQNRRLTGKLLLSPNGAAVQTKLQLRRNLTLPGFVALCEYLRSHGMDPAEELLAEADRALAEGLISLAGTYEYAVEISSEMLSAYSLNRLHATVDKDQPAWFEDALCMGQFAEADAQLSLSTNPNRMVRALLGSVNRPPVFAWLGRLAVSAKLRTMLSLDTKRALAAQLPAWLVYRRLLELWHGKHPEGPLPSLTMEQQAWLTVELLALASAKRHGFWRLPPPNILALNHWLVLSPEVRHQVEDLVERRFGMLRTLRPAARRWREDVATMERAADTAHRTEMASTLQPLSAAPADRTDDESSRPKDTQWT